MSTFTKHQGLATINAWNRDLSAGIIGKEPVRLLLCKCGDGLGYSTDMSPSRESHRLSMRGMRPIQSQSHLVVQLSNNHQWSKTPSMSGLTRQSRCDKRMYFTRPRIVLVWISDLKSQPHGLSFKERPGPSLPRSFGARTRFDKYIYTM